MANKRNEPSHDAVFQEWYLKAWLARLLSPGDFHTRASGVRVEKLCCEKTVNEYLEMQDSVERRTLKIRDAQQYSSDMVYRPNEFRKRTLKLINNPVKVQHEKCGGSGVLDCPLEMRCLHCDGWGKRKENCETCFGAGRIHKDHFNWGARDPWDNEGGGQEYARCGPCGGSGQRTVDCRDCDRGKVVCDRCNGRGIVSCADCDGQGRLVNGYIVTRRFLPSKETSYQLSGLKKNEFKNGLRKKHFDSVAGDLKHSQFKKPTHNNKVLHRETTLSYLVLSYHFSYKGTFFGVNLISCGNAKKFVPFKWPISELRLAVAVAFLGTIIASTISAVWFLA